MRIRMLLLAVLVALSTGLAAAPRPLLVSSSWLAKHIDDPKLVLLHVGRKEDFAAQHLPGARYVSLADLSVSDGSAKGLHLEMPPAEDLRARLQELGISDESRVVVYYGKDWVSPATRIVFTLDYAGLGDRTSLLDGGMGAWIKAGRPVTAEVLPARKGKLSPLKLRPIVVDAAYVRAYASRPGIAVVDARLPAFYDGIDTGGPPESPHKTGHIRGAHTFPFQQVTDDAMIFRPARELRTLFDRAGVKPGDTIVGYCHIGQQATAMLFAARTLGHKVLLYDGSFEDWSRQPEAAVETTAAGATP